MKIGVDFDGVIVKRRGIPTTSDVWSDPPMDRAVDSLWLFFNNKIDFYILTNRYEGEWLQIKAWLEKWNFPPVKLITNVKQKDTTIYLDDRAYRFTSWNDFRKLII